MVDPTSAGYTGPPFDVPVETGKIRELARAAGSTQPAYLGPAPVAPPLLLKTAQFLWEPAAGSAVARVGWHGRTPPLHARQEFRFTGPPPVAGDTLTARTAIASVAERPSRTLGRVAEVVLLTHFTTPGADSRPVAVARSTSVQPLDEISDRPPTMTPPHRPAARSATRPDRVLGPITLTDVVRYQGASGDLNPVHHDPAAARRAGWPAVLVPGLYPAAVLCDLATERFGAARLRRVDLRFLARSWVGDTLSCWVEPPEVTGEGLRVALRCERESDGCVITSAVAEFVSDRRR